MYQSQLKATGEEISQARYNAARFVRWTDTMRHLSTARDPGPTCNYYESWFDWDNPAHGTFQDAFRDSLGRNDDP